MKILWVTNVPLVSTVDGSAQVTAAGGGWLGASLRQLATQKNLELAVAFPGENTRLLLQEGDTQYWTFAAVGLRGTRAMPVDAAHEVMRQLEPDVLHVHGSEMPHSLGFIRAARQANVPAVLSIQGLVSVCAEHISTGLPTRVVHGFGRRPWRRSDRVAGLRKAYRESGHFERAAIREADLVVGRTRWDRTLVSSICPEADYRHCEETLREGFYQRRWSLDEVTPHSIFLAQGHYPLKGLHFALRALAELAQRYPNVQMNVAGADPVRGRSTPFGRYIAKLTRDLGVEGSVQFLGRLDEDEMIAQYLQANVAISPSLMENSPNAVCEAQILGVPVVASFVGGTPDLVSHDFTGLLYQVDAPYMLADAASRIFDDAELATRLSRESSRVASARHDAIVNRSRTLEIYRQAVESCENG